MTIDPQPKKDDLFLLMLICLFLALGFFAFYSYGGHAKKGDYLPKPKITHSFTRPHGSPPCTPPPGDKVCLNGK